MDKDNTSKLVDEISTLKQENLDLKNIAGFIAHEMRNPLFQLNGIFQSQLDAIGNLYSFVKMSEHNLEHRKSIEKGKRIIKTAQQLIDIILAGINEKPIDSGSIIGVSAFDIVHDSIADYAFAEREYIGKITIKGRDFPINVEPVSFKYVLYNLINNALYYVKNLPDARIIVTLMPKSNQIEVRDTGLGIAEESLSKLFDSFYTSNKQGGTGLGLAYCKRVMTELGGDIDCKSETGKYTAFTLYFPKIT